MNIFLEDMKKKLGKSYSLKLVLKEFISHHEIRFLFFYRRIIKKRNIVSYIIFRYLRRKYGLEINSNNIDKGLVLTHGYNITISKNSKIGSNCVLFKGVTIGDEFRGIRKGSPLIGDKVWIGTNSVIVGKIKIGNNVLIGPNCFINKDIPSNSIVVSSNNIIINSKNATDKYI